MKYIVINTKKYFTEYTFLEFLNNFKEELNLEKTILACNSSFYDLVDNEEITFCLQSFDTISEVQLNNFNIKYSLVGHRDDRLYKSETNENINHKIKELLNNGIFPIVCVGEEIYDKNIEKTLSTIFVQIDECLKDLSSKSVEKILIAYEPFWAISDGTRYAEIDFNRIRLLIEGINRKFEEIYSINPIILYGGSVNESNIEKLNDLEIDGFLIGSASTKNEVLKKIFASIT